MKKMCVMLVGIPGSGKSHISSLLFDDENSVIISSDKIREELGDVNDQSINKKVFKIAHARIKNIMKENKRNVIFDATNINKKRRVEFVKEFNNYGDYDLVCLYFPCTVEKSIANISTRERKVPIDVIQKMYNELEKPELNEGWSMVKHVVNIGKEE